MKIVVTGIVYRNNLTSQDIPTTLLCDWPFCLRHSNSCNNAAGVDILYRGECP